MLYIIGVIVQGYILYVYDSSVWFAIKTSAFYLILVMPVIYFSIKNANRNKKEFIRQFMVDQLTGLANRFAMIQEVRDKKPYALMLINLDSFREFNDFYGHKVGDSVLRQIALRLSGFIKNGNSDMAHKVKLFKLHADEFGIVFKNRISREELEIISEMVLQHIASTPLVVDGHDVPMNATIGIACMDENVDANGGQYLMTASNVALRQAKNAKKPFMFYDNSMKIERRYEQNIIWIKKLKTAIANNKIVPYYQPILNNKSKKIEKYECL
ncbi:MAG: diguanylate cyclase, partial [Campylobacteraceae bacterium]|nr:diguanylate cyclase [Campylobacteraceae bacterium]